MNFPHHWLAPLLGGFIVLGGVPLSAWGEKGHRMTATLALRSLPPEPLRWFKGAESRFRELALEPDQWKRADRKEGPRHYLDCEPYGGAGAIPRDISEAMAKVGHPGFAKFGTLPWVIQDRFRALVLAFQEGKAEGVVTAAAHLGHYVADAQVPLHTTLNHDGQLTDQRGIHERWESDLVERFVREDQLIARPARLESSILERPFEWLAEAFALVPKVLEDDRATVGQRGQPKRGATWQAAWALQGASLQRQLQESGARLGDLILTAWVAAGRPSVSE